MKNINRFSKEYYSLVNEYKHAHKIGIKKNNFHLSENITFDGKSLAPWIVHIKKIIDFTGSTSILDYGCGKAKLYKNQFNIQDRNYDGLMDYWNIKDLKLFDPGVEEYEKYPAKKYDGVVCTDVLEHIRKSDLDIVVKDIFNFSDKFVHLSRVSSSVYWQQAKNGEAIGAYGLMATPRDAISLAVKYLEILDTNKCVESHFNQMSKADKSDGRYGFQVWRHQTTETSETIKFYMAGHGGQYLIMNRNSGSVAFIYSVFRDYSSKPVIDIFYETLNRLF